MKKKIVPILLVLVVLFVLLMVVDSGFREKVGAIVGYVSGWLGVDWGPIRRWRSAELLYHLSSLLA
jgi:5-deoxy-D-glucuronate isomerase